MSRIQDNKAVIIRRQSLDEMKEIYQGMLFRHFPEDEIKPFRYIESAYKDGKYVGYGLYDKSGFGECLAYAWMCCMTEENWILLDYFAVTEKLRGQGIGSWFLKEILTKHTQGIPVIIEVEDPDFMEEMNGAEEDREKEIGERIEKERQKRLRRISFYQNNGVRETKLRARVFQVPYRIMVYLDKVSDYKCSKDIQSDVLEMCFDSESLKKAYYSFYSHAKKSVIIG